MAMRRRTRRVNPNIIMFLIGVILMVIVLVMVLVKGQQIKEADIMAKADMHAVEWHNWR